LRRLLLSILTLLLFQLLLWQFQTPLPFVAVIVLVPIAIAVNTPVLASIVPTLVLLLVQFTVAANAVPFWSSVVAVNVVVLPITTRHFRRLLLSIPGLLTLQRLLWQFPAMLHP